MLEFLSKTTDSKVKSKFLSVAFLEKRNMLALNDQPRRYPLTIRNPTRSRIHPGMNQALTYQESPWAQYPEYRCPEVYAQQQEERCEGEQGEEGNQEQTHRSTCCYSPYTR